MFALVLKFKTNLIKKAFSKRDKTAASIDEVEISGKKIIKMAQSRAFTEEMSSLGSANYKTSNKTATYIH